MSLGPWEFFSQMWWMKGIRNGSLRFFTVLTNREISDGLVPLGLLWDWAGRHRNFSLETTQMSSGIWSSDEAQHWSTSSVSVWMSGNSNGLNPYACIYVHSPCLGVYKTEGPYVELANFWKWMKNDLRLCIHPCKKISFESCQNCICVSIKNLW